MSERDGFEAARHSVDPRLQAALADASQLLDEEGIEGVGEGLTADGQPCVVVMVVFRSPELDQRIPASIKGVPVEVSETGQFTAEEHAT